jgi:hypothetical protein
MTRTLNRVADNLFRDKASGRYYCIIKRNGKQLKASLQTSDPQLAKRKLDAKIRELETTNVNKRNGTFGALVQDYRETVQASKHLKPNSLKDENFKINTMLKEWGAKRAREISQSNCDTWVVNRLKKVMPRRVNHEMQTLKELFRFAIRESLTGVSSMTSIASSGVTRCLSMTINRSKFVPPATPYPS